MRKLKCIISIMVGLVLGLVASCRRNQPEPPTTLPAEPVPAENNEEQPVKPEKAPEAPKNETELPVRRPMLE